MVDPDDESFLKEFLDIGGDLFVGSVVGTIDLFKLAPTLIAGSVVGFMEVTSDIVLAFLPKKPRN